MDIRKFFPRYASQNHTISSNHAQPAQEAEKDNTLASLDFIFDLMKERMAVQLARIDGLDNKANFIMGAGTALVSTALTLQAAVLTSHTSGYCTPIIPTFIHHMASSRKTCYPFTAVNHHLHNRDLSEPKSLQNR